MNSLCRVDLKSKQKANDYSQDIHAMIEPAVGALNTFIAAVYEHVVILPNKTETPVSVEKALFLMNKNIDILEKAIKLAAKQGAHIIVTPEDELRGWSFTRETIYPYLEDIPDPEVNWVPCRDPKTWEHTVSNKCVLVRFNQVSLFSLDPVIATASQSVDAEIPPVFLKLCCHHDFTVNKVRGRSMGLQICTLLKCQTANLRICEEPVGSAFTKFEEFSLSGTFGTNYVFPQMVLSGNQLVLERYYEVGGLREDKFL
ncbi:vascular non-inflammatory molecule 3-like [Microtus ochrogaster]|uniref:Vascular non-inflammatory molecule 3-like n=1 Tax=Microtus ochrogaster TaxID=79684 RepID=A0ABM1ARD1_MICOH|nr:vascular non-inflammatory molecule 3-like [Microtus ochrogaster]